MRALRLALGAKYLVAADRDVDDLAGGLARNRHVDRRDGDLVVAVHMAHPIGAPTKR